MHFESSEVTGKYTKEVTREHERGDLTAKWLMLTLELNGEKNAHHVLGFTKNPTPNFNLTTEYKNVKDSKKADGAIVINSSVTAIIELKGTKTTDLSKIEEQAFGYKNNQPDCKYIITSNFEKLRFYIDNAIEHLEFNLFELTFEQFQLLYLCLACENISADIPAKNESRISQSRGCNY